MSMQTRWSNAKAERTCNIFPDVWAAIVGCTGKGRAWRYGVGHFGRRSAEFACPTCRAAKDRLEALRGPAHVAALGELAAAAGVADYRIAEVARIDGRPVLTGKVCGAMVEETVRSWALGTGDIGSAARAILAYGGDCTRMVAQCCTRSQRAELAAAYRAAKLAG